MISHFGESPFLNRFPLGFGVQFFFVLSSFLITRILLNAKEFNESHGTNNIFSLKQFYARRFLRIFPIYYLLIIFLYLIDWEPCRKIIISLLTYTTNFKIASGFNTGSFNHLWSLAVEEQFYIFFPLIIFFLPLKNIFKVLAGFVFAGVLGRAILYLHNSAYIPYSNFNTISCLDSLGIGAILAFMTIYKTDQLKQIISNRILFALSCLSFLATMIFSYSFFSGDAKYNFVSMVFMRFFFNVMCFWILGWSVTFGYTGIIKKILENKAVVYLGRISYGMYLYHLFVPQFVAIIFHHFKINVFSSGSTIAFLAMIIINISVTIIIASVSWYIIEKPMNNLKKYFSYNKKLKLA